MTSIILQARVLSIDPEDERSLDLADRSAHKHVANVQRRIQGEWDGLSTPMVKSRTPTNSAIDARG